MITGPPEIPIALQNTSSTFESVELQWSPPSFNGGSVITQYHINVSPPSNTGDSGCTGGQCSIPDTRINVTGLDFNQQYNFTVRAENIAGIGKSVSLAVFVIGLGELL